MTCTITCMRELDAALATRRARPRGRGDVIELAAGDYVLTEPIRLDERDSGLTLRGRGSVTLYGGCRLAGWRQQDRWLCAPVPPGAAPRLLLVNGESRPRARFPAQGTLTNRDHPVDLRWLSSTNGGWNRPPTHDELTHMTVDPGDIPADMDVVNAEVTVVHMWDESTVRVASFDRQAGLMEFQSETGHPAGAFNRQGYVLWNTREGLTAPGQWYFDRARAEVVYFPRAGETPETIGAWIPVLDHVITLAGGRDLALADLRIALCNSPAAAVGLRAIHASGAIEARGVTGLRLSGLQIADVVGTGIRLLGCRDLAVDHCQVRRAGAGGLFTHECENETIVHNTVESIGRISFSAIGIHCGWKSMLVYVLDGRPQEKGTVLLAHNTIRDVPYCGITCNGGPHRIEYNRLSQCMTVLHDGAAIYCSRGDRTILRGNYAFDIDCDTGYAYYFDEQSRYCVLEGNLAVDVPNPFLSHLSEHVVVRRNLFVSRRDCTIRQARSRYFTWRHNVVVSAGAVAFRYRGRQYAEPALIGATETPVRDVFGFSHCLVFSRLGKVVANGQEMPPGEGVLQADPRLTVGADGAPAVETGSPLLELGFALPDGRCAGVDAPEPAAEIIAG